MKAFLFYNLDMIIHMPWPMITFSKVWWHYADLFEIYYFLTFIHTIQSHSFILHHSPRPVFLTF
jgi:hypothetical protein